MLGGLASSERAYLLRSVHPDAAKRRCLAGSTDFNTVFSLVQKLMSRNATLEKQLKSTGAGPAAIEAGPSLAGRKRAERDSLSSQDNELLERMADMERWLETQGPVFMGMCGDPGCGASVSVCDFFVLTSGSGSDRTVCAACFARHDTRASGPNIKTE